MKRITFLIILTICGPSSMILAGADEISEEIRQLLERSRTTNKPIDISGYSVISRDVIFMFYHNRGFDMAWENAALQHSLINAIGEATLDGLNPEDYHLTLLRDYRGLKQKSEFQLAEYDLLLSDAFLIFGSHLLSGKVNPASLNAEWKADRREADMAIVLEDALKTGDIASALDMLRPKYKAYDRLRRALALYRNIEKDGGWKHIPAGETLKPGMENDRIPLVRERLFKSGDLENSLNFESLTFDDELAEAVIRFQRRHGLQADGAIGSSTLAILNTTVQDRIEKLVVNLERCRWLPQDLGEHYILTNIANYELEVVKNGEIKMEMDVIVGKEFRKTPVFSSRMTYLVINPTWTVPPTILANDVIPAVKRDISYLSNQKMKIISGIGSQETEIDPTTIAWDELSARNFPYMVRQDAGTHNALGAVKFMFPNSYNVYLHDTNRKDLFDKVDRALSSGCIRTSKPLELAAYLLADDSRWSIEILRGLVATGKTQTIMLPKPINVHLLYWTAYMDENGLINFRKDIYDRDASLLKALKVQFHPV